MDFSRPWISAIGLRSIFHFLGIKQFVDRYVPVYWSVDIHRRDYILLTKPCSCINTLIGGYWIGSTSFVCLILELFQYDISCNYRYVYREAATV